MIPGYILVREGRDPSKPYGLFALGVRLRMVGRGGTAWVVSKDDGKGRIRYEALGNAVAGTLARLRVFDIGESLHFTVKDGPDTLREAVVRIVDWTPKPVETNGSPQVDLYVACLNELWGSKYRQAGTLVCKKVSGTDTWSDHAYGEAIDLFASWDVMDEIADWTVASYKDLNVSYVILRDRIWTAKAKKWATYKGVYHNHVHTSFQHDGAGTPPCAR